MFAEELKGNASRKRAEETKAKRRLLLQKQQKQQQQQSKEISSIVGVSTSQGTTIATNSSSATSTTNDFDGVFISSSSAPPPAIAAAAAAAETTAALPTVSASAGSGSVTLVSTSTNSNSNSNNNRNSNSSSNSNSTTGGIATSKTTSLSAVEKASLERQRRAEEQSRVKAVIRIQAVGRRRNCQALLLQQQHDSLASRLHDLQTIKSIVEQKQQQQQSVPIVPFVPPAATTTALVQQLLYITFAITTVNGKDSGSISVIRQEVLSGTSKGNHLLFFQQLLDSCLLPGMRMLFHSITAPHSNNNNNKTNTQTTLNVESVIPFLTWMDTSVGRYRLEKLLRLLLAVLFVATAPHASKTKAIAADTNSKDNNKVSHSSSLRESILEVLHYLLFGSLSSASVASPLQPYSSSLPPKMSELLLHCRALMLPATHNPTTLFLPPTLQKRKIQQAAALSPARWNEVSSANSKSSSANKTATTSVKAFSSLSIFTTARTLDYFAWLRYYLLFCMQRRHLENEDESPPIPSNAADLRQACYSTDQQDAAWKLFSLVLRAANTTSSQQQQQQESCWIRMCNELFTVPLLCWKLSPAGISQLITKSSDSIPLVAMIRASLPGFQWSQLPLNDVPLTICPATPTQCLLANLVQISRLCPELNGSAAARLDYRNTAVLMDFITVLLLAVPLATFATRDSAAVEWITDTAGHSMPIVLSQVILDHCHGLLSDSYVRRLFQAAMVDGSAGGEHGDYFQVDKVLAAKNDKDLQQEDELRQAGGGAGTASAAASLATDLAAKEARIDRSQSLFSAWNSSKWAKNLSKTVTNLLSSSTTAAKSGASEGHFNSSASATNTSASAARLLDNTAVSRQLAKGKSSVKPVPDASSDSQPKYAFTPDLFYSLCRAYAVLLARWGGGGGRDEIRVNGPKSPPRNKNGTRTESGQSALAKPDPFTLSLLNILCFSTTLVKTTWAVIQSNDRIITELYQVIDSSKGDIPVRALEIVPHKEVRRASCDKPSSSEVQDGAVLLYLFVCTLSHILIITDDVEIHDMERPLPIHQIRRCIQVLKKLLYRACYLDTESLVESNYFGLALITASSRTMRDLYDRSSRRPLCVPKLWLVPDLMEKEIRRCKTHADYAALFSCPVLRVCPFLVSFKRRLKLFERIVTTNRVDIQGENSQNPFHTNPLKPAIPIRITRGRILEDGLATMNHLGRNMRQRIAVQYVNEAGVRESGIDAGGLFKEFWTDLSAIAFNPNYALFRVTEGAGNCLFPNPSSGAAHGSDHIVLFEFLGRILGKALYEGITIHPRFSHFFLSFLRGDYNFLHMLPDLYTVDPQLYNNLMFLKTYDGDAADLCLTFTITNDDFGGTREIPLIPNGSNVEVTNANKQRYIGLVAKYYVVDRVKEQSEAFTRGLWDVIDRSWLRIFNEPELQVLISGASDGKIDIEDMKANTRYIGGYTGIDRTINRFWNVVATLDSRQQAALLRFVTSCERPPPLGFASMNPPFTIQRVGLLSARDEQQLPSASTCFNTLKLPTYSTEKILRQRLLYAIESGSGFELS